MAKARGKQRVGSDESVKPRAKSDAEDPASSRGPIPELMRRAIALGLTGFFTTEEAVRRALGDTVPKDWTDYLAESSDRTRSEFLERLSHEIGHVLENVDIAAVLHQLLEGRTLKVNAEFQLSDREGKPATSIRFTNHTALKKD